MSRCSKGAILALPLVLALQACNQVSPDVASANDVAVATGQSENAMPPDQPSTAGQSVSQGGVTLPTYQASNLSAAGRLTGTLARSGDCLFVRVGTGDEGFIPLFPHGRTSWDAEREILTLNSRTYRVGDQIDLGGGSAGPDPGNLKLTGALPRQCPRKNYWMVSLTS